MTATVSYMPAPQARPTPAPAARPMAAASSPLRTSATGRLMEEAARLRTVAASRPRNP